MSRNQWVLNLFGLVCVFPLFVDLASATSLLVNGSFEVGPSVPEPPGYLALGDGDTSVVGWIVEELAPGGTVDIVTTWWQPHADGVRSIDLNGTPGPGSIGQTFPTTAGALYQVLFDIASNPTVPSNPVKTMEVSAAGQSEQFAVDSTGHTNQSMGWDAHEWYFTANSLNTTLTFSIVFPFGSNEGVGLDNVRVNLIPEPSTALLVTCVLLGFMAFRNRKGRKGTFYFLKASQICP